METRENKDIKERFGSNFVSTGWFTFKESPIAYLHHFPSLQHFPSAEGSSKRVGNFGWNIVRDPQMLSQENDSLSLFAFCHNILYQLEYNVARNHRSSVVYLMMLFAKWLEWTSHQCRVPSCGKRRWKRGFQTLTKKLWGIFFSPTIRNVQSTSLGKDIPTRSSSKGMRMENKRVACVTANLITIITVIYVNTYRTLT